MITEEPLHAINQLILLAMHLVKQPTAYMRVASVPLMMQDVFEGLPIAEIVHWFTFVEDSIDLLSVCLLSLFGRRVSFLLSL
jgi:hypothetical protein